MRRCLVPEVSLKLCSRCCNRTSKSFHNLKLLSPCPLLPTLPQPVLPCALEQHFTQWTSCTQRLRCAGASNPPFKMVCWCEERNTLVWIQWLSVRETIPVLSCFETQTSSSPVIRQPTCFCIDCHFICCYCCEKQFSAKCIFLFPIPPRYKKIISCWERGLELWAQSEPR